MGDGEGKSRQQAKGKSRAQRDCRCGLSTGAHERLHGSPCYQIVCATHREVYRQEQLGCDALALRSIELQSGLRLIPTLGLSHGTGDAAQDQPTAADLVLDEVHLGEGYGQGHMRVTGCLLVTQRTLSWMRSTLVRTLTWGASSCAMAASTCRQPAMNLGVSVTNWLSRQYTTHTCGGAGTRFRMKFYDRVEAMVFRSNI